MDKSPFLSLMVDSSCDVSVREHCNLFVRYIDPDTHTAHSHLLEMAFMTGTMAKDYLMVSLATLEPTPLWRDKLIGLATHGASTMRGCKNGLAARLTRVVPGLLSIHCIAHDLQLAILDAAKDLDYMRKFDDTLKSLFKYYQNSSRRLRGLELAAQEIGMAGALKKLTKVKTLRWAASEKRAVEALLADWKAVVAHLEEEVEERTDTGAAAQGFLKTVASARFVSLLHFLADLFYYLGRLSESFQNDDLVVSHIPSLIDATTKKIGKLRKGSCKGGHLEKFKKSYNESTGVFAGVQLSMKHATRADSDAATLIEASLNHIEERFTSVRENNVIAASAILHPLTWPADLNDFGSAEISTLAEAFQAQLLRTATAEELPSDCQVEEQLEEEWEDYLDLVGPERRQPQSYTELMSRLRTGRKRFPLFYLFAQIVDVLPAHPAWVERGFSLLNRLKDKKTSQFG